MKKTTKKLLPFVAAVLAMTLVAGTWAFYTSRSEINNELLTKKYGDKTVEEFTPKQKLQPGSEVTKEVGVTNTGDYDLVVRIKMDEKWTRGNTDFGVHASDADTFNSVAATKDVVSGNITATDAKQANEPTGRTDGLVAGDETVMYKNLDLTNWTFDATNGYWYYSTKLAPGLNTGSLLKSLVLANDTDMGKYDTNEYWSIVAKDNAALAAAQADYDAAVAGGVQATIDAAEVALDAAYNWQSGTRPADETIITFVKSDTKIDPNAGGYADAQYTLTITTEVCQATADAVEAEWTNVPASVKTGWGL